MERCLVPSEWHSLWCDDKWHHSMSWRHVVTWLHIMMSHKKFWGKRTRKYPTQEVCVNTQEVFGDQGLTVMTSSTGNPNLLFLTWKWRFQPHKKCCKTVISIIIRNFLHKKILAKTFWWPKDKVSFWSIYNILRKWKVPTRSSLIFLIYLQKLYAKYFML